MAAASRHAAIRPKPRVIFLGPPGAGKGTQAERLANALRVPRISTGDMLREHIARGDALGEAASPYMERGGLVPDDLLVEMIRKRIASPTARAATSSTAFRARWRRRKGLEQMSDGRDEGTWWSSSFEVPHDELLRRLSGRRWCPTCQATYHVDNNPPKRDTRATTGESSARTTRSAAPPEGLRGADDAPGRMVRRALALPPHRRLPAGRHRVRSTCARSGRLRGGR